MTGELAGTLPDADEISDTLLLSTRDQTIQSRPLLTQATMVFGQFLDHDIVLTPTLGR